MLFGFTLMQWVYAYLISVAISYIFSVIAVQLVKINHRLDKKIFKFGKRESSRILRFIISPVFNIVFSSIYLVVEFLTLIFRLDFTFLFLVKIKKKEDK